MWNRLGLCTIRELWNGWEVLPSSFWLEAQAKHSVVCLTFKIPSLLVKCVCRTHVLIILLLESVIILSKHLLFHNFDVHEKNTIKYSVTLWSLTSLLDNLYDHSQCIAPFIAPSPFSKNVWTAAEQLQRPSKDPVAQGLQKKGTSPWSQTCSGAGAEPELRCLSSQCCVLFTAFPGLTYGQGLLATYYSLWRGPRQSPSLSFSVLIQTFLLLNTTVSCFLWWCSWKAYFHITEDLLLQIKKLLSNSIITDNRDDLEATLVSLESLNHSSYTGTRSVWCASFPYPTNVY